MCLAIYVCYKKQVHKKLEFSTRVVSIAHLQQVLKQVGVVHDIKSQ